MNPAIARILTAKKKGGGLHPLVQAWYDYLTGKPTAADLTYFNNLISGWAAVMDITKLEYLYVARAFSEEASLVNVISPGTGDLVKVGSPVFTTYDGWAGLAGSNQLHNNVAMNTYSKYTLNDCHIGVHSYTSIGTSTRITSSAGATAPFATVYISAGGYIAALLNSNSSTGISSTSLFPGYVIAKRTASNANALWKNGSVLLTDTHASSAVPAGSLYFPGYGAAGNTNKVGLLHVGASLSDAEIAAMNTVWQAYITATS